MLAWFKHLETHPPLRAMVQAYLRIKPRASQATSTDPGALIGELMNLPGAVQMPHGVLKRG